jgi:membrane associated rhomboid family serine protease
MTDPRYPDEEAPRRREPVFNTEGKAFTLLFSALCVAAFLYQDTLRLSELNQFISAFALTPYYVLTGIERTYAGAVVPFWLPLFTHMLLHGGFWHLFLNLVALLSFGPQIERTIGSWRMALLFILGGLAAAFAEIYLTDDVAIPMLGASGAIFAVIAAYVMLWPTGWLFLFIVAMPGWVWVIAVILLHVALGWIWPVEGIAWWAHMGGLVAGAILIVLLRPPDVPLFQASPRPPRRRRLPIQDDRR